ncbi:MAG: UDP-N-acetyl-D-glucosamine dehydrogenase, partial [Candidatus Thorarchaeota archaeon]
MPVACLCAINGYKVYGTDIDKNKVSMIEKGICPIKDDYLEKEFEKVRDKIKIKSTGEAVIESNIIIICVPTPIDNNHIPDLTALKSAATSVSEAMKEDTLVIIESTIFPGTTEEVVFPILKKSNVNFYLAHCPERIDPGNKNFTIENIPRVVSGIDKESSTKAYEFYKSIINAPITELSSVKAVEATKIMENT